MVRFACLRIAGLVCLSSLAIAPAVFAQETSPAVREAIDTIAVEPAGQILPNVSATARTSRNRRPASLVPLYVSFGALQVLDAHSTSRALGRGAVEANPLMKPFAGSGAGLLAVKAAGTAGVIYASEKMWKKNKVAAVVFMVAANSAMAWVVQNNYRAVR
jgi:hypothetical protein